MKKMLPFLFVAFSFLACDDYVYKVYDDVVSASNSYKHLEEDITSATDNVLELCDRIEDEDLRDEIKEQIDIINSSIEDDGSGIAVNLEEAIDEMFDRLYEEND